MVLEGYNKKCQSLIQISEQEVSHIPEVWERKPEDKSFGKIMLPEEQ